jgi:phage recombination protein Bet
MTQLTTTGTTFDRERIDIWKKSFFKELSDTEMANAINICARTGLVPEAKQIYFIKLRGAVTPIVSIDGQRLIAHRTGEYGGTEGPYWCGDDGVWHDVWMGDDAPVAAKFGVYRKGAAHPFWGVALFSEFAKKYNGKPADRWADMGSHMLAKCAESQALRKAFPAELSGLYTPEEEHKIAPAAPGPAQTVVIEDDRTERMLTAFGAVGITPQMIDDYLKANECTGTARSHSQEERKLLVLLYEDVKSGRLPVAELTKNIREALDGVVEGDPV